MYVTDIYLSIFRYCTKPHSWVLSYMMVAIFSYCFFFCTAVLQ